MTGVQTDNSRNFILSVFSHIKTVLLNKAMFFSLISIAFIIVVMEMMFPMFMSYVNTLINIIRLIVYVLGAILIWGAIIYASFLALINKKINFRDIFYHSRSHIGSLLGTIWRSPAFGFAYFFLFFLFLSVRYIATPYDYGDSNLFVFVIILIPIMSICCIQFVTLPACIVENIDSVYTLERSKQLTKDYRLHIFGIIVILILIHITLLGSLHWWIEYYFMSFDEFDIRFFYYNIFDPIVTMLSYLSFFLTPIVITCVYYELRLRKEPAELNALIKSNYYYK
ncbi:hypothetical protein [Desulfovibrio litoralis]|uniref:Uncharacterized protein n=1 Tax=Desulfovibrio litoralis DSM 11393 TaxID=1121455 RepID=A0A1M7SGF5_9BACT|nr:hypothetical protein [Desulfovibrio litoralis]SHN57548.1 hypothetical protein SAMN02745728_00918 [Desulfovibrio litoralis DSM 11393]